MGNFSSITQLATLRHPHRPGTLRPIVHTNIGLSTPNIGTLRNPIGIEEMAVGAMKMRI